MMYWFWIIGLAVNGLLAYRTRKRLESERELFGRLSALTAILVWSTYLLHLALTVLAAVLNVWPMPLAPMFGLALGSMAAAAGLILFFAGSASFASFKRMSGTVNNGLVTCGIYRWSRNPQNAGWMAFLLGVALLGRSGLALVLAGLFWGAFVAYVPKEEDQLEQQYGDEYRDYVERTHRYLGPVRRTNSRTGRPQTLKAWND